MFVKWDIGSKIKIVLRVKRNQTAKEKEGEYNKKIGEKNQFQ